MSTVSLCDYDHPVTLRSHISIEVLRIDNFVCNMAAAFIFHNGPNILHFMPKFFRENMHLFEEKIHDRKRNGKESILNSQCVSEFMNGFWSFQAACLNRKAFGFLWKLQLGKGLTVWLFTYCPPLSLSPLQKPSDAPFSFPGGSGGEAFVICVFQCSQSYPGVYVYCLKHQNAEPVRPVTHQISLKKNPEHVLQNSLWFY